MGRMLRYLLIFVPIAAIAAFFIYNDLLIFATSAIALIALAAGRRVELAGRRDTAGGLPDRWHRLLLHSAG